MFPQRWGDAPVHSIGAALFAKKEEIHFFNDIGLFLDRLIASQLFTLMAHRIPA